MLTTRAGRPAHAAAVACLWTAANVARHAETGLPLGPVAGSDLRRSLEAQGIVVRCPSRKGLAEEAPLAYKDVERVVGVVERAGLARRVARLVPLGVVKG